MHPLLLAEGDYDEETIDEFHERYSGFGKNLYILLKEKLPFLYHNLFFYKISDFQSGDSFAVYENEHTGFAIQLCAISDVIVLWNKEKHMEIGTWTEVPEEIALQKIISDFLSGASLFTHVGVHHSILTTTQPVVAPAANKSVLYDVK